MKSAILFLVCCQILSSCANITDSSESTESAVVTSTGRKSPSILEIFCPPFVIFCVFGMGFGLLILCSQKNFISSFKMRHKVGSLDFELYHLQCFSRDAVKMENINVYSLCKINAPEFLSPYDKDVLDKLAIFCNNPREILRICIPALVTLFLGPFAVLFYHSTTEFFWPLDKYPSLPNNNQCVSCFLTPAGLVYAISFGFAFSQALTKQADILNKVTTEISYIDQTSTLTSKLKLKTNEARMKVYSAIKAEAIYMMLQMQNRKCTDVKRVCTEDVKTAIWNVLDLLRSVSQDQRHHVDVIMCRTIINYVSTLNNICSDSIGILHSRTHWLLWAFLITLGFFSLYGVLLIQAHSYRMELMMSTLTLFSITMLCYIVADLDSPFSGFFRIDISIITDVIYRLEVMYKMAALGFEETVCYPDSSRFTDYRRHSRNDKCAA